MTKKDLLKKIEELEERIKALEEKNPSAWDYLDEEAKKEYMASFYDTGYSDYMGDKKDEGKSKQYVVSR